MSSRYAVAVSLLLAVALVPTVIHSYFGAVAQDGRAAQAIGSTLAGLASKPTERSAQWVEEIYDSVDWIERRYRGADGSDVLLFVVRSYNLKRLYHHPELGVAHGVDLERPVTKPLPGLNGAPVHVLRARNGQGVVAYGLLYEGDFIADPIALQFRTAWELLFSARKPMTLFLVYDRALAADPPFDNSRAARVLTDAVTSFRGQAIASTQQVPPGSGAP